MTPAERLVVRDAYPRATLCPGGWLVERRDADELADPRRPWCALHVEQVDLASWDVWVTGWTYYRTRAEAVRHGSAA